MSWRTTPLYWDHLFVPFTENPEFIIVSNIMSLYELSRLNLIFFLMMCIFMTRVYVCTMFIYRKLVRIFNARAVLCLLLVCIVCTIKTLWLLLIGKHNIHTHIHIIMPRFEWDSNTFATLKTCHFGSVHPHIINLFRYLVDLPYLYIYSINWKPFNFIITAYVQDKLHIFVVICNCLIWVCIYIRR